MDKNKNINKKTYKINGMECASCAAMIEMDLEDAGIKAKCSYAKQTLEVDILNNNETDSKVKMVIESSGYKIID